MTRFLDRCLFRPQARGRQAAARVVVATALAVGAALAGGCAVDSAAAGPPGHYGSGAGPSYAAPRVLTIPPGASHGPGYGFGTSTYRWGWFGTEYRGHRWPHVDYYGRMQLWSYRHGY